MNYYIIQIILFINYTLKNCSELKQRNVSQEWKHGPHFSYTTKHLTLSA